METAVEAVEAEQSDSLGSLAAAPTAVPSSAAAEPEPVENALPAVPTPTAAEPEPVEAALPAVPTPTATVPQPVSLLHSDGSELPADCWQTALRASGHPEF